MTPKDQKPARARQAPQPQRDAKRLPPEQIALGDEGREARYRAPALDKGLDILEILSTQARGLTRSEILRHMGMSPSQIYRMLERLVARGYVCRLEGDRYALTMKLFQMGSTHPPLRRLVVQAQPLMDRFASQMQQSCHLVVPETGAATIVAQASPGGHFEFRARIGALLDLFESGSGQTLLAFQPPERRIAALQSWGIADPEPQLARLEAKLAAVRLAGYRSGPSLLLQGVTDVSVPIFATDGAAIAVITCAMVGHAGSIGPPSAEDSAQQVLAGLTALAAELSQSLSAA